MKRFIEGVNRTQSTLFPESLEDYIAEDNPVRVFDDPRQAEMAAGKSMVRLADEFPTLQKDELAFKKKI